MDISIFLAKAFGIYLLVISIAMFINAARFRTTIQEILENPPLFLVSSFIALILGILLILSHNIWQADWRVLITIIGWIIFLKGTVNILFPQYSYQFYKKFMQSNVCYYIATSCTFIFGLFIIYIGFLFI